MSIETESQKFDKPLSWIERIQVNTSPHLEFWRARLFFSKKELNHSLDASANTLGNFLAELQKNIAKLEECHVPKEHIAGVLQLLSTISADNLHFFDKRFEFTRGASQPSLVMSFMPADEEFLYDTTQPFVDIVWDVRKSVPIFIGIRSNFFAQTGIAFSFFTEMVKNKNVVNAIHLPSPDYSQTVKLTRDGSTYSVIKSYNDGIHQQSHTTRFTHFATFQLPGTTTLLESYVGTVGR